MPRAMQSCKEGHERVGKKCLKSCAPGSERGTNNRCKRIVGTAATKRATTTTKRQKKACPSETHRVNQKDNCVLKCAEGTHELNLITDRCNLIKTKKAARTKTTQRKSRQTKKAKSPTPLVRSPTPLVRSPTPLVRSPTPEKYVSIYDADVMEYMTDNTVITDDMSPEDMDQAIKEYIEDELTEFKEAILEKEVDIAEYLTEDGDLSNDEIYALTIEEFMDKLKNHNTFHIGFIPQKYMLSEIKKLLDRVKMIEISQNADLETYDTVKEAFQDLTNRYHMAITPGMAKYIDEYIKQKNRLKKKIDETGEHFEEEAPDYRDSDYYDGETYGFVVEKEKVAKPFKKGKGRFGY